MFWTRGMLLSLAGAVAFYVVMSLPDLPAPVHTVFTMWHNVCFTGVWVAGFVLLYRLEYFRKVTVPLLTYGRMSLTNYVSQSLIGSLIFFPYALGLAPYCGYLASFTIGCAAHGRADMVLPLVAGAAPLRGAGRAVAPGNLAGRRKGGQAGSPVETVIFSGTGYFAGTWS